MVKGFKFVGAVTVYAFMQAVGMVNDHGLDCPRRNACCGVDGTPVIV
jgi:DNA-3-methyladenine glycosylase I